MNKFSVSLLFFQTSYFISLNMLMWHRILHMQETNMTQVHQLNIQTILLLCFCFLCRMNRSLCNPMFWFLEWYFCGIYIKSGWWNFTSIRWTKNKTDSFHCLDITFIQDINFQYLAGPLCCMHSSSYMLHHLVKLIQIWCWSALHTQYELILIIVRSKVFNGKRWSSWS